jgi:hypothetical protein
LPNSDSIQKVVVIIEAHQWRTSRHPRHPTSGAIPSSSRQFRTPVSLHAVASAARAASFLRENRKLCHDSGVSGHRTWSRNWKSNLCRYQLLPRTLMEPFGASWDEVREAQMIERNGRHVGNSNPRPLPCQSSLAPATFGVVRNCRKLLMDPNWTRILACYLTGLACLSIPAVTVTRLC